MADASKLKLSKNPLGDVPKLEEASANTLAPEIAPFSNSAEDYAMVDWRTMRRTNRTVRFATSVTPEFNHLLRKTALGRNMLLSEVLEEALKLYCSKN